MIGWMAQTDPPLKPVKFKKMNDWSLLLSLNKMTH